MREGGGAENVSLHAAKGEFAAVVGESSSGKSTLLNLVARTGYSRGAGKILVEGRDLFPREGKERTTYSGGGTSGLFFQGFHLIPELTVEQNLVFPVLLDHQKPDMAYVEELMGNLGLKERRKHLPSQLSGDSSREWRLKGADESSGADSGG